MNKQKIDKLVSDWAARFGIPVTGPALASLVNTIDSEVIDHFALQKAATVATHAREVVDTLHEDGRVNKFALEDLKTALAVERPK